MGICSRKQADLWINQQRVTVNSKPAFVGQKIATTDMVEVNGRVVHHRPKPIFLLYHKPVGVVCTHDLRVKNNIEQAINYPQRVFAVGRLDKDSEGLMLLTNQGDAVNKIMRAENKQPKVYKVWVNKTLTPEFVNQMQTGVAILNTVTLPCQVKKMTETCFEITLTQGLNLQIRRMCKALGYSVQRLQRTQIMDFSLQPIAQEKTYLLTDKQTQDLLSLLDTQYVLNKDDT